MLWLSRGHRLDVLGQANVGFTTISNLCIKKQNGNAKNLWGTNYWAGKGWCFINRKTTHDTARMHFSLCMTFNSFLGTYSSRSYCMPATKWRGWWHASCGTWQAWCTHTTSAEPVWLRMVTALFCKQELIETGQWLAWNGTARLTGRLSLTSR